jgi:hypothetical protein
MKIEKKSRDSGSVSTNYGGVRRSPLLFTVFLLIAALAAIFWRAFLPSYVFFSNDGPYGAISAEYIRMHSTITGVWANLNWFGGEALSPAPSVSSLMRLVTTPFIYSKILCPIALLIAGIGACFCFRKLRLAPVACVLGGLAAAFNSDFFSTSCWGVSTQVIGFGFMYIAVGLIADPSIKRQWVRVVLAGLAVGVCVMEAYDIGALFSMVVALFVFCHELFLTERGGTIPERGGRGVLRVALVAGFAGFIAAHTILSLVGTQIQGIQGTEQDEASRKARWEYATSYSTPKLSTLQVFIPGIVGFRDNWYMYEGDSPKEDQYWTDTQMHPIGTGYYAGVPVVAIAFWAFLQSLRRNKSPFTILQCRAIWFWSIVAVIGLLLAWGNFAPFYQFFYALPYASTIRNPQKFMHIMSWALIIVFAYGVHGLAITYLKDAGERVGGALAQFKEWLAKASGFERGWWYGSLLAVVLGVVGWFIYSQSTHRLADYLQTIGVNPADAPGVARFSVAAVGWFAVFLTLTVALLGMIFSRQFAGDRSKLFGILLGGLILIDLGRADAPWISYWDLDYKYAKDPVVEFLADKPYEHRVALVPQLPPNVSQETQMHFALLVNTYNSDWKQHIFPSYNIQCAEVIQEPRMPVDKAMYMNFFPPNNPVRFWQFNNTRYLLGATELFKQMDPQEKTFKILKTFDFVPKQANSTSTWPADWHTELRPTGHLAVVEFLGALPRAKLYPHWQVNTDDVATLQTIANPAFDLNNDVLVSNTLPQPTAAPGADPGTVEINPNYKSKRIEMQADVKTPSVLLFSERYNPKWQVEVDGKMEPLLKCNFIERGVYLTPGKHTVVMRFAPPIHTLWLSLAAIVMGLGLWGYLIFSPIAEQERELETPSSPASASKEKTAVK